MLFRSSNKKSCIFSYRNIYRRTKTHWNVSFLQHRAALIGLPETVHVNVTQAANSKVEKWSQCAKVSKTAVHWVATWGWLQKWFWSLQLISPFINFFLYNSPVLMILRPKVVHKGHGHFEWQASFSPPQLHLFIHFWISLEDEPGATHWASQQLFTNLLHWWRQGEYVHIWYSSAFKCDPSRELH